jgi:hypothetical protein
MSALLHARRRSSTALSVEFEDVPEDRRIAVYSLKEIATAKIATLQDGARDEPRARKSPAFPDWQWPDKGYTELPQ